MQERTIFKTVRVSVFALAAIWVAGMGWREFVVRDDLLRFRAATVSAQGAKCSGSFSKRYDCRSSLMINNDNAVFLIWVERLSIVIV